MTVKEDIETIEDLKRILEVDIKRIRKLRDSLQKLGILNGQDLNEEHQ